MKYKITILILIISLVISLLIGCSQHAGPSTAAVETACPIGLVNDEYPGSCAKFDDKDNNTICDLSE